MKHGRAPHLRGCHGGALATAVAGTNVKYHAQNAIYNSNGRRKEENEGPGSESDPSPFLLVDAAAHLPCRARSVTGKTQVQPLAGLVVDPRWLDLRPHWAEQQKAGAPGLEGCLRQARQFTRIAVPPVPAAAAVPSLGPATSHRARRASGFNTTRPEGCGLLSLFDQGGRGYRSAATQRLRALGKRGLLVGLATVVS